MAKIDHIVNTTKFKMNALKIRQDPPRTYLGASSLGDECWRKLYYQFHHVSKKPKISGKLQRIFDNGHIAEGLMKKHLKMIGIEVWDDQLEIKGFAGHGGGYIDGKCTGFIEHQGKTLLAEFKAVNSKTFTAFQKEGVFRESIRYYSQMQNYMGRLELEMAAFMVINKNNSDIYIEFVPFDKNFYEDQVCRKERDIITSEEPPRAAYPVGFYKCGNCEEFAICRLKAEPEKVCRSCKFSELEMESKWSCSKKKLKEIDKDLQFTGCEKWQKGWGL